MHDEQGKDVALWAFPAVEDSVNKEDEDYQIEKKKDEELAEARANELNYLKAKEEAEQLQNEYNKKIKIVNDLISQLKDPVARVDEELIEMMNDVIKKVVKKIVLQELSHDPKIMHKMIEELSQLIKEKNGMINIYLSQADFDRLEIDGSQSPLKINVDPSLSEGDVIIKSNATEIRAILDERIEQLIRIQNG